MLINIFWCQTVCIRTMIFWFNTVTATWYIFHERYFNGYILIIVIIIITIIINIIMVIEIILLILYYSYYYHYHYYYYCCYYYYYYSHHSFYLCLFSRFFITVCISTKKLAFRLLHEVWLVHVNYHFFVFVIVKEISLLLSHY